MKHNNIIDPNHFRSSPNRKFIIFLLVIFVISTGFCVAIPFIEKDILIVRIVVWVMCGLFALLSLVVLILSIGDYVEVNQDKVIFHFAGSKHKFAISKLTIEYKDNAYQVKIKDKVMHVLDPRVKSELNIYYYLVNHGAKEK